MVFLGTLINGLDIHTVDMLSFRQLERTVSTYGKVC
jgi:hypothetical protein